MGNNDPTSGRAKRTAAVIAAGALATTSVAGLAEAGAAQAGPQTAAAVQPGALVPAAIPPAELANLTTYDQRALDAGKAHKKAAARRAAKKLGAPWSTARAQVVAAGGANLASAYDKHISNLKAVVSRTSPSWGKVTKEAKHGLALDAQMKALFGG